MQWILPGTVLRANAEDADHVESLFQPMFLAGGMVLSQVSSITGLEPYIIQNWVKRGFLTPPQCKRYTLRQLCRILNINMLKGVLPMERICGMLTYINGQLDDDSDDTIDDSQLISCLFAWRPRPRSWTAAAPGWPPSTRCSRIIRRPSPAPGNGLPRYCGSCSSPTLPPG